MSPSPKAVTTADLPVKTGPKYGIRAFTDEEEDLIYRFVQGPPKEKVETAAVHCRVSVATIWSVIKRAKERAGLVEAPVPERPETSGG